MVEFALIAPIAFLLLTSIVVAGIMITNYIQVTNIARDGARVAAICVGDNASTLAAPGPALTCDVNGLETYMQNHLVSIPAAVNPQIKVCAADGSSCTSVTSGTPNCVAGELLQVDMSYNQPLYLPLVSDFLSTNSNGSRTLQAAAEATCE
jgi:Flp pilus assembly protein TadG